MFFTKAILMALAASPLVSAHGRVESLAGDAGGAAQGLGVKAATPLKGRNAITEPDTSVFGTTNIKANTLGKTTNTGKVQITQQLVAQSLAEAGGSSQVPQVSDAGTLTGVYRTITTDGGGPIQAIIDTSATGQFSNGVMAQVMNQPNGNNGNVNTKNQAVRRNFIVRELAARGLWKRAQNVGAQTNIQIKLPAGVSCTGTVPGVSGAACLMKISNNNRAGAFGTSLIFQMANGNATAANAAQGNQRRGVEFQG